MKVSVEWSFTDTEFEETYGQYEQTCRNLGLPKVVNLNKISDSWEEDEIEELLEEEFGFEVESWEVFED